MIKLNKKELKPTVKEISTTGTGIDLRLTRIPSKSFLKRFNKRNDLEIDLKTLPNRIFFKVFRVKEKGLDKYYLKAFATIGHEIKIDVTHLLSKHSNIVMKYYKSHNLGNCFKHDNLTEVKRDTDKIKERYFDDIESFLNMYHNLLNAFLLLEHKEEIEKDNILSLFSYKNDHQGLETSFFINSKTVLKMEIEEDERISINKIGTTQKNYII
jgi:hypothetical protein